MSSPLLIFSDDWGRHPSSCQHLVKHLLAKRRVDWVNTIGTRSPKFDLSTVKRVAGKLRTWTLPKAKEELPANLTVHHPKMWPWFKTGFDRGLNRRLLMRSLKGVSQDSIAVTTLPIVADLVGKLPAKKWVYYCVDDFSQWPGLDQRSMDRMERELVGKVDTIIAVSETLRERLKSLGRSDSHLLTHGVDIDFWRAPDVSRGCESFSKPLVVFWGVIDRRMDTAFIQLLSEYLEQGTILLVGPENDPDPELFKLKNVQRCPAMSIEELPALAAEASVLVMPYIDAPVSRAMQPLKLKEYLATGKPVVARDLPANREWADALDLAATPGQFTRLVLERLRTGTPETQTAARMKLAGESWEAKARQFEGWIEAD